MGRWTTLALAAALGLAGCGLLRAHDDSTRSEDVFRIAGTVSVDVDHHVPIVVALLRTEPGSMTLIVSDHVQLYAPGPYEFLVTAGRYRVIAFEDDNDDVRFDPTERVNSYDDFRELVVDGTQPTRVDLHLGESSYLDRELPPIELADDEARGVAIGTVVARDDARLSQESGTLGAWEPVHFMEQGRAGIFQLSEHDRARVPVVLVHGFAGWGGQFEALLDALDRERFEPWIAAYPSGWALEDVARVMRASLNEMITTSPAERVCVVAHSMGGLVAWRALTMSADDDPVSRSVRGLVTLASPLGGHPAASEGLRMSPVIVSAWRDLAPGSVFVRAVEGARLPAAIRYTLLFAFQSGADGDGVVPLRAQLPRFAQDAAAHVAGFETTHVGILSDAAAEAAVLDAIDSCARTPDRPTDALPSTP